MPDIIARSLSNGVLPASVREMLPGSPHPRKLQFKEALQSFCRGHALQPEATYIELMKLVTGVDQSAVLRLDPTLTDVKPSENKLSATGTARREVDGQTTTMSFENSPGRGWLIVE